VSIIFKGFFFAIYAHLLCVGRGLHNRSCQVVRILIISPTPQYFQLLAIIMGRGFSEICSTAACVSASY